MTFESWFGPEQPEQCPVCGERMSYAFEIPDTMGDVEQRITRYQVCRNLAKMPTGEYVECSNHDIVDSHTGKRYASLTYTRALNIELMKMMTEY